MTNQEKELEDLYGQAAKFSEFRRGDRITYHHEQITCQGTILWVAAPDERIPTHYVVLPDGETDTMPHLVLPGDVSGLVNEQEPILRKCPFCTGYHSPEEIELCPL